MPPFTIDEFSALVSAALDGDGTKDKTADFSLDNACHLSLNQSTTRATPTSTFAPTCWQAMSTVDHINDCMGLLPAKNPQTPLQQKKPLALFSKIKRQLTSKANAPSSQQPSVSHAIPGRHGKSATMPTVTFASDLNYRSASNFDDTDEASLASTTTTTPRQTLEGSSPPSIASASPISTPSVYSCASLIGSLPEENRTTFEAERTIASRSRTIPSAMSAETCSVLSSNVSHCTDESDYIPFLPLVLQQERLARQIPLPKAVPLNAASWSTASLNSRQGHSLDVPESRTRTLSHISTKRLRKPTRQESLPVPLPLHHARSTPSFPLKAVPVANVFDDQNPPSPTSSLETRGPATPSTPQFVLGKPKVKEMSDGTSDSSRPNSTDGKEKTWPDKTRVIRLNPESIARERTLSPTTSPSSSPTPYDSASPRRPSQRVRTRSRENRPPPTTPPPSLPLPSPTALHEPEPSRPPSTVSVHVAQPKDGLKPSASHTQFLTTKDVLHPDNLSPKRSRDRLPSRRSSPLHGNSPAGSRVQSKVWAGPPSPVIVLQQEDEVTGGSSSAKSSIETDHRPSTELEEVDVGAGVFVKVRVKKENIAVARQLPQPASTSRSKSKKGPKAEWTLKLGADESEPEAKQKTAAAPLTPPPMPDMPKEVYVTAESAFGDVNRMRMRTKSESALRSLGQSGRTMSGKSREQPKERSTGNSDDWTLSLPLPSIRDYERSRHVSTIGTEKGWAEPISNFGRPVGKPRNGPVIRVRDVAGSENELVQDDASSQISSVAGKEEGGALRVPRVIAETRTTPRQRHMTLPSGITREEPGLDDDDDDEIDDPKVKENLAKLAALDQDLARFNALLKSTNASVTSSTKKGRHSLSPAKLKPSKSSSFFDFNSGPSIMAESTPKRTRSSNARPTNLKMNEDVSAPFDSGLASPKHAILRMPSSEILFEPKPAHVRSSSVVTSATSSTNSECAGLTLPVLSPAPEAVQPKPVKVQLPPASFAQPITLPSPPASPPPMSPTTTALSRPGSRSRAPLPFAPSLVKPSTPTSPPAFTYGSASGFAPSSLLAGNVSTPPSSSRGLVLPPPSLIVAADRARVRSASTASSRPSTGETLKKGPPPMLKIHISPSPPAGQNSPPLEKSPLKTPTSTTRPPVSSNQKGLVVSTAEDSEDWRTSFMSMSSDTSMTPTITSPGGYQSDECGPTPLASFFPTPPPLSEASLRAVKQSLEEGMHTGTSGLGHVFGCVPPVPRSCSSSSARTSSSGKTVKPSKGSPGGSVRSSARSSMAGHGRAESSEMDVMSMESGTYYTARSSFSEWF